jgi:hypothetical protein
VVFQAEPAGRCTGVIVRLGSYVARLRVAALLPAAAQTSPRRCADLSEPSLMSHLRPRLTAAAGARG